LAQQCKRGLGSPEDCLLGARFFAQAFSNEVEAVGRQAVAGTFLGRTVFLRAAGEAAVVEAAEAAVDLAIGALVRRRRLGKAASYLTAQVRRVGPT
jgi:hypothetical protein